MRRLLGFIRSLPPDAAVWQRMRVAETAGPPVAEPKRVDYDALRALGGEVKIMPRKAG